MAQNNDTPQPNLVVLLKRHIAECDDCGESRSGGIIYLCTEGVKLNRELGVLLDAKDPSVFLEWPAAPRPID
jgi:hypothetical protein